MCDGVVAASVTNPSPKTPTPTQQTVWRGAVEGYAPEVLRAHTVSHLDALRLRCQAAGSTVTRISADDFSPQKPPALLHPITPAGAGPTAGASSRPQRRASSNALGLSASSAAAASLPSPGHHYHGSEHGSGWGAAGGNGQAAGVMDGDTFGTRASFVAASVGFAGALQAVDEVSVIDLLIRKCVCAWGGDGGVGGFLKRDGVSTTHTNNPKTHHHHRSSPAARATPSWPAAPPGTTRAGTASPRCRRTRVCRRGMSDVRVGGCFGVSS